MLGTIAWFEVASRLRRVSTYIYFTIFFLLTFLMMNLVGGAFPGGPVSAGVGGKANINSPVALHSFISLFSYFGIIVTGAVIGRAVYQDFETGAHPLFFTKPITKAQYLGGRFLGAFIVMLVIFSGLAFGCFLGSLVPWIDRSRVGTQHLLPYVMPYLTSVIPNLLFSGVIFFSLAALARRILPIYVVSIVFLVGYLIASLTARDIDNRTIGALLDPFGMSAVNALTEYWPPAERNIRLVTLSGLFLWNRLLWLGVAFVIGALSYRRFAFAHLPPQRRKLERAADAGTLVAKPAHVDLHADARSHFATLFDLFRLQLRETLKSVYFVAILLCGVGFVGAASTQVGKIYGTITYPVTYEVLEIVHGTFALFVLILATFFSGELVWRERDARVDQIVDAMPLPSWVTFSGKLLAMLGLQTLLTTVVLVCGIVIQLMKGYTHFELGLYFKDLYCIKMIDFWLIAVLAVFIHVIVNNKYLGHFILVLYYLVGIAAPLIGLEHNLVIYDSAPDYSYSDMNGYGHFVQSIVWFRLYWALVAVAMALVAQLFFVRGVERGFRWRLAIARARLTTKVRLAIGASVLAAVAAGGFVFYNTNILNHYYTSKDIRRLNADYERLYKKFEKAPKPSITSVHYEVEIHPKTRRADIVGRWDLVNNTDKPLDKIYVSGRMTMALTTLTVDRDDRLTIDDRTRGFYELTLGKPIQPHEAATLRYVGAQAAHGFLNAPNNDLQSIRVYGNGTFLTTESLLILGYQPDAELSDDSDRRKENLTPKAHLLPTWDEPDVRNHGELGDNWVGFDAVVGTDEDQLPIAPGRILSDEKSGGRRHIHYHLDAPALDFWTFLSARYAVAKDSWNGIGIEVDYQPGHEYNVARMIAGVKASLDYYTKHFSPYQFDHVRIIEFPRYASFAQSFANTIPFSESIGFIAKVNPKDPDDVDYPFYVTAHEVGHQWWAHQLIGARAVGASVMVETLAQYSALMVMKHDVGAAQMKRFLKDELDQYLRGRVFERKQEAPLYKVESQPYIYYNKGSVVMYALQDYLGEDVVNGVLADFLKKHAFEGAPHRLASDLVDEFKKAAPPGYKAIVSDLFEKIVLYQNRALSATAKKTGDKWEVRVKVACKKLEANANGLEQERPLDEWIDVGVLDDKGVPLALERKHITQAETEYTFVVTAPPARAGIDPLVKLVDRKWEDNTIPVEK
jgi:ABC-2 type transport system permease protein